jgi:hypothetical protein
VIGRPTRGARPLRVARGAAVARRMRLRSCDFAGNPSRSALSRAQDAVAAWF